MRSSLIAFVAFPAENRRPLFREMLQVAAPTSAAGRYLDLVDRRQPRTPAEDHTTVPQIARPKRCRSRTRRSSIRGTPRGLFDSNRPDRRPLVVGELVAHDLKPRFGGLNHGSVACLNIPCRTAFWSLSARKRTRYAPFEFFAFWH
jgi:hypothetical protein